MLWKNFKHFGKILENAPHMHRVEALRQKNKSCGKILEFALGTSAKLKGLQLKFNWYYCFFFRLLSCFIMGFLSGNKDFYHFIRISGFYKEGQVTGKVFHRDSLLFKLYVLCFWFHRETQGQFVIKLHVFLCTKWISQGQFVI